MAKKILIIDDEADVRTFLVTLFKKHGYETTTADDGSKGLELIRDYQPDLVTLDLMMPNKTGTDFYRKLVKDEDLSKIPIIVVSGLPGRHLAVKQPEAVFDKPIDPDQLIAAVEKAIGLADDEG